MDKIKKLKKFISDQKVIANRGMNYQHYGTLTADEIVQQKWWKGVYDALATVELEIYNLEREEKENGKSF